MVILNLKPQQIIPEPRNQNPTVCRPWLSVYMQIEVHSVLEIFELCGFSMLNIRMFHIKLWSYRFTWTLGWSENTALTFPLLPPRQHLSGAKQRLSPSDHAYSFSPVPHFSACLSLVRHRGTLGTTATCACPVILWMPWPRAFIHVTCLVLCLFAFVAFQFWCFFNQLGS